MNEGFTIFLIGTIALSTSSVALILFIYLYQRKLIKKNLENQEINNLLQEQEMKTAYALLEGQDKERKRIAAELHDNLGSILTSLNMFSDALQMKEDPKQIASIAEKISNTSNMANEEVRKISHSLDSGLLNHFGLKPAINHLMEAIASSKPIEITTDLQIEEELKNETGLEVYRMIQELVNNALKHSECHQIRLDISHIKGEMSIIFQDDGIGFDPEKVARGMGLNNLNNRVGKLDGKLTIESNPGKGSTFIIEFAT